jgi:putative transposase
MVKFRDVKTPQTFSAAHASIYNHFNLESHLNLHNIFKQDRTATLAERRQMVP